MAVNDFTGKNIQDTYQRVVQTDGTNLADGTGSLLPISFEGNDVIVPGALIAESYIVSESIINVSSGSTVFGNSSDDTHTFTGNITASGNISSSGTVTAANMLTVGRHYFNAFGGSNAFIIKTGDNLLIDNAGLIVNSHITASGNISASGKAVFSQYEIQNQTLAARHPIGGIALGNDSDKMEIEGANIFLDAPVTASIISASLIQTPIITGDTTEATGLEVSGYISATNITASGNISASGTSHILGGDLTISDDFTFGIHSINSHPSGHFTLASGSTSILSAQGINITASGNISASGDLTVNNINGTINGGTF